MDRELLVQLPLVLGLIIAAAKIAGRLARKAGQPRVFGELLVGVILGPSFLNFLELPVFSDPHAMEEYIHVLAELGVIILMFNIGLDVHLHELLQVRNAAVAGGILGAVIPVAMALPVVLFFDYSFEIALFAGVALAATSVSISAETLLELGFLRTREGSTFLATTLIDDMLAILLLSFVTATVGRGDQVSISNLVVIVLRMTAFISLAGAFSWFILPPIASRIQLQDHTHHLTAAFALAVAFMMAWAAEELGGVAGVTGAFIAGMGLGQSSPQAKEAILESVDQVAHTFLASVFFVSVGLAANLWEIPLDMVPFALLLLLAAVLSKILGCSAGGIMGGLKRIMAFRVSVCMVSRGEVGLIIVTLGRSTGVFDDVMFASLFLVVLVTTVLTPVLVRWAFQGRKVESTAQAG